MIIWLLKIETTGSSNDKALDGVSKRCSKSYFLHLKEKALKKLKTNADEKWEKINDKIEDTNRQIKLLEETVAKLKADGDKYSFEVEKKTSLVEIKATLPKANTLKRATFEK